MQDTSFWLPVFVVYLFVTLRELSCVLQLLCDLFSTIYVCVSSCIYTIYLLYLFARVFIRKNILNILKNIYATNCHLSTRDSFPKILKYHFQINACKTNSFDNWETKQNILLMKVTCHIIETCLERYSFSNVLLPQFEISLWIKEREKMTLAT